MPRPVYDGKRFWCAPEGRINLSDNGFLVDPDGEYGSMLNPDVVHWDAISSNPCLVLLGEPGIASGCGFAPTRRKNIDTFRRYPPSPDARGSGRHRPGLLSARNHGPG